MGEMEEICLQLDVLLKALHELHMFEGTIQWPVEILRPLAECAVLMQRAPPASKAD